ncbi:MAG TPA: hypothetical protein VGW12_13340 [Pyrinomonadaceae bacterium]|nr:hypothetical protein [Pyrinomonadaceae bacterium]
MNCQKCKLEIEDRNLSRELLSDAAEAHLSTCAACRLFAKERIALRRLVGELEKVSAPADFDFRMRARMAAERSAAGAPRTAWFKLSPAALSWPLAGCLALVVSVSLYLQAQRTTDAPAATPPVAQSPVATTTANMTATNATADRVANGTQQLADASTAPRGVQSVNDERPESEFASSKPVRRIERPRGASTPQRGGVESATAQVEESASLGVTGSTPHFAAGTTSRVEAAPIPVQLDAPEGQLKVLLRDTSGEARTISVDSVSFGSRDVVTRRPGPTYTKASLSSNQGVW